MNNTKQLMIFGGGAYAVEIASYIAEINHTPECPDHFTISDIICGPTNRVEDIRSLTGSPALVREALGEVDQIEEKFAIIAIGDPAIRRKVAFEIEAASVQVSQVIHPLAHISASAQIDAGCIIAPFAFIGPYAKIGAHAAINVSAIIGHDASVGAYSSISPGAKMNGYAACGEASFLGAGAIIYPTVKLGSHSKLSAGSVLSKDAGDGHIMHGNPAAGRQMIRLP